LLIGCEDEVLSGLGESCQRTSDCQESLLCVYGSCNQANLQVTVLDARCVQVDCLDDFDCCDDGRCRCEDEQCSYGNVCRDDADCFEGTCVDGECHACMEDADCFASGSECIDGQCTECSGDADCRNGLVCAGGFCEECADDHQCADGTRCSDHECVAYQCQDDDDCGVLTECKQHECVERGCLSDRECIQYMRDPRARCSDDDGRCTVKCQTDAECGSPFTGALRACHEGTCEDIGCDSDVECRARLYTEANGELYERAVCR
jgi:hypothetical protein